MLALSLVLVGLLPAQVRLVDLHGAAQGLQLVAAGDAQAVQHVPGGRLRDVELLRQLHRGYALAGRHQQVGGEQPFARVHLRALQRRSRPAGEVLAAVAAPVSPDMALLGRDLLGAAAAGAERFVAPRQPLQVADRVRLRRVLRHQLEKAESGGFTLPHRRLHIHRIRRTLSAGGGGGDPPFPTDLPT